MNIRELPHKKITEMTVEEILTERKIYEDIVHNCKYETPKDIEDLFEAYTMLIWKHKQVGYVPMFYFDGIQEERDGGDNLSGAAHVILDTLRALARTPDLDCFFEEIHCTGDPVNGFRFGQVVWNDASTVDGIGPNAATYIKMFPAVFRQYELSRDSREGCFDTLEKVGNYAKKLFIGAAVEQAYLLMFNNRLQLIDTWLITDGTVNSVPVLPRAVVEHALDAHASSVVLVHNHPYGNILPSRDDIELTHVVEAACNVVGIHFLDHLVVAGNDFSSILRSQKGYNRNSPMTGKPDSSFYRNFYKE